MSAEQSERISHLQELIRSTHYSDRVYAENENRILVRIAWSDNGGHAAGIIAAINHHEGEEDGAYRGSWAAYLGGCEEGLGTTLAAQYLEIARYGTKLTESQARQFFSFDELPYRT